jgi:hypothetical protein
MLNPLATFLKSQPLFTPAADVQGATEQSQSTKALLEEARCGNRNAISSLITYAAGADDATGLRADVIAVHGGWYIHCRVCLAMLVDKDSKGLLVPTE